ncbi:MAG: N-acetylmuramoyl-L-alanine amidase, partial [Clostridia bacterium]|nr:N-acetylmuramoyl-L-alanine amidase [Clostridia bacterium]
MIVLRGKKIAVFAVFLASVFAFIICLNALFKSDAKASANGIKIVLDAGHGGIDDGAIGSLTGAKESEINLSIVNFLKEYLSEA